MFAELGSEACWIWPGMRNAKGYGQTTSNPKVRAPNGDKLSCLAHRRAYQLLVGPVPNGMQLDHLCRNKACCNPAHLEVVTNAENMRRSMPHRPKLRATCKHGHAYPPDARVYKGARVCAECKRITTRKRLHTPEGLKYQRDWKRAHYRALDGEARVQYNEMRRRQYHKARAHAASK